MFLRISLLILGIGLGYAAATSAAPAKAGKSAKGEQADRPDKTAKDVSPAAGSDSPAARDASSIAATVNGHAILASQVEAALAPTIAGRQLDRAALPPLQAEALAQLIDRTLVEQSLSSGGQAITPEEVSASVAKFKAQLEGQKITLDQFLAAKHLTLDTFREQIAWQLLWERAMQKHLTNKALEGYFEAHKKDFDGSEVRASHILFRPVKAADPQALATLVKAAAALRDKIEAGKISFAEAAAKYSAGPSREKGGDIGFFPRAGLMAEPFSQAAFALDKGQISQPVVTAFGVHLIQVTDVTPGKKKWNDVAEQLKPPAAQAVYDKLAKKQRDSAQIEFTGAWPHFKPGTRELATPEAAGK